MENTTLINKYIAKLNDEVIDATKRRIVSEAQTAVLEETATVLNETLEKLQSETETLLNEAQAQVDRLVAEKEDLRAAYEKLKIDFGEYKNMHRETVADLQNKNATLTETCNSLKNDLAATEFILSDVAPKKKKKIVVGA